MKIQLRFVLLTLAWLAAQPALAALNIFACTPEWGALSKEVGSLQGQVKTIDGEVAALNKRVTKLSRRVNGAGASNSGGQSAP